ncbi:vomeronasal type-2 receptor 26-like [Eleutherodactylus coqui]|uniref:vomeronasal type-2 receptor 26-like n=1 Tax=Eleutherodactylus coqui TaxID=57060 RepID=UPI00346310B5
MSKRRAGRRTPDPQCILLPYFPRPALDLLRHLLVFIFAIEEINRRADILPNITLGYKIYDSCMLEHKAVQSALSILSGREEAVPNYSCDEKTKVVAFIGHLTSSSSLSIAEITGLYGYPQLRFPGGLMFSRQISYGAMDPAFTNKLQFPYFYRTVPEESAQYEAVVLLLKHFGWSWVGMVTVDDESSRRSGMELYNVITRSGICVAYTEPVSNDHYIVSSVAYRKLMHQITKIHCDIILFVGSSHGLCILNFILSHFFNARKVAIILSSIVLKALTEFTTFHRSFQLAVHEGRIPGLKEHLLTAGPLKYPEAELMFDVWKEYFSCCVGTEVLWRPCDESDVLGNADRSLYDVDNFRYTFSVYSAVYIVAHALHHLIYLDKRQEHTELFNIQREKDSWKLNRYMKGINFMTPGGELIYLDDKGNGPVRFDLVNYNVHSNGTVEKHLVGHFHEDNGHRQFTINDSLILWNSQLLQIPSSACSESCLPGYRKVPWKGKQKCCYYCVPCAEGEISNQTNMERCLECPEDRWSNERRDTCIPRPLDFLSYEDTLGLSLIIINLFFCFVTVVVSGIYIKNKDTSIVKANNQSLSYILLLSLLFSFLCPLLFIGRPTRISCLLRHVGTGIICSLAVSSILAKTVTVVLAFHAIQPGRKLRRWLGRHLSTSLLITGTTVEILICVFWLSFSPPFPDYNTEVEVGKIILQCNEGSVIAFYMVLGYIGFLAVLSFIIAFLARKLPDVFNEAQYISFSMLVFCSVWISFIPAYLSTKGKYMVAVEVFAISASSAGFLGCIFIPKCYIILLRPELNTKFNRIFGQ